MLCLQAGELKLPFSLFGLSDRQAGEKGQYKINMGINILNANPTRKVLVLTEVRTKLDMILPRWPRALNTCRRGARINCHCLAHIINSRLMLIRAVQRRL